MDSNECIGLLKRAITSENITAAEFLVEELDLLKPTTQPDANLINHLIKIGASGRLLRRYLAVKANLGKIDEKRRTPVQVSMQEQNHEALAILREMGIDPADSQVKFEISLAETRTVIKSLIHLGANRLIRRALLTQKWKAGVINDPREQGKLLSLSSLVYEALIKRETALVRYLQSRAGELSGLFAHSKAWEERLGTRFGGAALGPVGHLALRLIQDGGSENITYLRLMHALGLRFDFLNVLVLPPPVLVPPFDRLTVMQDSVFESALTGWISHPIANNKSNIEPQLTYSVKNPREDREDFIAPRPPDLEMLLFLLNEVRYEPELRLPHQFEFLRSPELAILEHYLTSHSHRIGAFQDRAIDIFEAALPTNSPHFYGKPENLTPKGSSPAKASPTDLEVLNRIKIEMIISAGFDPLISPTLQKWFEEIRSGESKKLPTEIELKRAKSSC